MDEICTAIEGRYIQLKAGKMDAIHAVYLNKLYLLNVWSTFKINGEIQQGKIYGISKEGYLEVELANGTRQFGFKEIEFINA